jgi:RecA/RadA recombinase
MAVEDLLAIAQKEFQKRLGKDRSMEVEYACDIKPVTGLIVDNPLFEYVLDRRFLAYGRCYLTYGKKGCSKTSLFLNIAKMFQAAGGDVYWIETEKAADLDYARRQGLDMDRLVMPSADSLQEALTISEALIRGLPKAYPDGDTPVLICLDSIAACIPEYEMQSDVVVGETKVGEHARLMSGFYRRIVHPLAYEKAIFLAINQLKDKIGGMSFGPEAAEAMIGGEAPRFHSTYQLKVERTADMAKKTPGGAERKIGSKHRVTAKRNKLGREGNTQRIEFDLYIDGGIDWWNPLVRKLATEYTNLVVRRGGYYYWEPENTLISTEEVELETPEVDPTTGKQITTKTVKHYIPTDKGLREAELSAMIQQSTEAKEMIRTAFEIPELPPVEVVEQVEKENKKKRGKKSDADDDNETVIVETL